MLGGVPKGWGTMGSRRQTTFSCTWFDCYWTGCIVECSFMWHVECCVECQWWHFVYICLEWHFLMKCWVHHWASLSAIFAVHFDVQVPNTVTAQHLIINRIGPFNQICKITSYYSSICQWSLALVNRQKTCVEALLWQAPGQSWKTGVALTFCGWSLSRRISSACPSWHPPSPPTLPPSFLLLHLPHCCLLSQN